MAKKKKKSLIREWMEAIFIAFGLVLVIRSFGVEAFTVPSPSMEQTLLPGDFILVNKINYGPRLLRTPLTFPFSHQTLPFFNNVRGFVNIGILPYLRMPGFQQVKHNDIVVFNYPMDSEFPVDHRTHFIKRCVGLPGDTIKIKNALVYINNSELETPEGVQFNYTVKTTNDDPAFFRDNYFSVGGRFNSSTEFRVPLSKEMFNKISKDTEVLDIKNSFDKPGVYQDFVFPYDEHFSWNIDHFGPLVIPEKGKTVTLTNDNISIYQRIIEFYEENSFEVIDGIYHINGIKKDSYTFKMDYYFMMGDNRHYSSDSRFWGFVPEDHILGKASIVLFSIDPQKDNLKKVRWKRFFTLI